MISGSARSAEAIAAGSTRSASSISASRSRERRFLTLASVAARASRAASCAVNALVEATPISGPARVRNLSCEPRTSADSGTLQMASENGWPSLRAWLRAAIVSAVSPDCEITMTSVRGLGTVSR